ncbi:anthranilate phosphoribosyltransferase [Streptomyces subrutilus]|uniref:anthranilate phosphoribosyltransferase n=1 Tax=Streptomyces subrutilus TaxID=36818 RepID=UPI0033D38476
MHDAVAAVIGQDRPVDLPLWRSFWDALHERGPQHERGLRRGEAIALLASLSTAMPGRTTLTALLDSLAERRPGHGGRTGGGPGAFDGAVNIVGTGGGPSTFNISTAAALVAAAAGTPVVKTGSRAYTSPMGSVDLLERLGIPLTRSYEETHETLEDCGIAFAGSFVYPAELALLARAVLPLDIRGLGRCINALGPFLADMPVSAQVTGVSDARLAPALRTAAAHTARAARRRVWLAANDPGADELLGCAANRVNSYEPGGEDEFTLDPALLGLRPGTLEGLRPRGRDPVAYFLAVLGGEGTRDAKDTVCLNAAALAVAGHTTGDWHEALARARAVIHDGGALALLERLRTRAAVHA